MKGIGDIVYFPVVVQINDCGAVGVYRIAAGILSGNGVEGKALVFLDQSQFLQTHMGAAGDLNRLKILLHRLITAGIVGALQIIVNLERCRSVELINHRNVDAHHTVLIGFIVVGLRIPFHEPRCPAQFQK